ncbi:hypothetical protein JCM9140_3761 [Halalkalibacter wakoensis JCM 9140]|uniref:Uncharacterized protein n=1 Tax=Halalkalibacter wakoensis JCM 9140 TaxID=1236970 RepID=W4Q7D6_9BACI|nr:UPF0158 family protein [Halalkalibacter wakoensis]GAE27608.1 hypothetical protein JCM9140_3761 [Halalkalibacter wakoensis JCM 9140]
MPVKLEDILEGIELQSEESLAYLNRETSEIVYVSEKALLIAEDGEEYEHLPDWQQEEAQRAYDIVESSGKYISLPTSFDIHEYDMIERFCYRISDPKNQDLLLHAIKGKGAFRRFKDTLHRLEMIHQWYEYRDQSYKEVAKEFCESNSIDYIEE